jgi:hypothetical protein
MEKKIDRIKKSWTKPFLMNLSIKKTYGGTDTGPIEVEGAYHS